MKTTRAFLKHFVDDCADEWLATIVGFISVSRRLHSFEGCLIPNISFHTPYKLVPPIFRKVPSHLFFDASQKEL